MKEEIILHALDEIRDERLLEAALYAPAAKSLHRPKRFVRVLLIAAVLTTLFSVTAFAVWQSAMKVRIVAPGEKVTFHLLKSDFNDDYGEYAVLDRNVALTVTVEGAEAAHWVQFRACWLPEPAASSERLECHSFYDVLSFASDHSLYVGWRQRPLEQLLREANMSAEEAESWYNRIDCDARAPASLLDISVYDATLLHNAPLIFGAAHGATAEVIREGTLGDYELLELQVDYSAFYREQLKKEAPAELKLQNHVLLYEPTEKYLIRISGSDSAYSFESLEKIGENLEVLVTDFETQLPEMASDYLYCDLGRG